MQESDRISEEFSNITLRMKNMGWIESDGDGSIRIVDDLVGTFSYSDATYKLNRTADKDDIPTHIRLNHVYFDTIRGRVDDKYVRRLVPFYVVSLYKKDGNSFRRLRVRNRADRTFLPRQLKLSKLFSVEDYKGYECSICLNQDELDALVKKQVSSVDRRIVQIPGPFLFKYHKILYEDAKDVIEDKLIMRKRGLRVSLDDPLLAVGEADDMAAPFSDGMIRLGGDIQSMTTVHRAVKVNDRYFDVDGNLVSAPNSRLTVLDDTVSHGVLTKRLPYKVKLYSIHSSMMVATFGKETTNARFVYEGNVYVCRLVEGEWKQQYITAQFSCSMMRWCKDTLLVVDNDIVKGFDTSNANVQTLTLRGHMDSISSIDVKSNKVVTGSKDNHLIVWESQEPALAKSSRVLVKDSKGYRFGNVKDIDSGSVCEVDLLKTDREKVKTAMFQCTPSAHSETLYGHTNAVEFVVWGKYIVSSSTDKTIIAWKRVHHCFVLISVPYNW